MNAEHGRALRGRWCLLTGATGGVGRALALVLGRYGCHLVLSGRDDARLAALAAELRAELNGDVQLRGLSADLADPVAVEALATGATTAAGAIDILVNCAGLFLVKPLADSTLADYETLFAVNVRAPFLLTRALAPAMLARGWGRVVNIGSSSSYAGFAGTALYSASKHALLGLSRATQAELGAGGVRTLVISPGSVKTAMGRLVPDQDWDTFIDPVEVAEFAAFAMAFDGAMTSEELRLGRLNRPPPT